jgi:NAD(P)H-dependent FMN reductase
LLFNFQMSAPLRIIALPGSLRKGSYNRMLLELAVVYLEQFQAELDQIDLRDFPLPPYDGDIEDATGLPQEAWTLKARIAASHGVLIAAPEYNGGVSGMFKNVIDWTSRGGSNPWEGKVVGLMGATIGPWGTWRGQPHLRQTFTILNAIVLPQTMNVPRVEQVWTKEGELLDQKLGGRVEKFVKIFLTLTDNIRSHKTA